MENHPGCSRCGLLRESYFSPDFKDPGTVLSPQALWEELWQCGKESWQVGVETGEVLLTAEQLVSLSWNSWPFLEKYNVEKYNAARENY